MKIPSFEVVARATEHIGVALSRFRKYEGWTQAQTGESAGVKQTVVSSVESGTKGTRLETLFKILAALDLEIVVRKRRKAGVWPKGNS